MDAIARQETLKRLEVLVGEWVVEAELPGRPPMTGRSVFEWTLDGQFLVQRTQAPNPVPDSTAIIVVDAETGCTYHYYDSRGVVRVYAMSFADGVWRLLREVADFSPLDFRQRYTGLLSEDGDTIRGVWEKATGDTAEWEPDFPLAYRRSR
jgi:hypothetical protein